MKKTIEIKKKHLLSFILSITISYAMLFSLNNFGKFSYISFAGDGNTEVSAIYYSTFFNNKVATPGNGFTVYDLNIRDTEFNNYQTKLYYYLEATKADYKFGLLLSLFLFIIFIFFNNFKIKFK